MKRARLILAAALLTLATTYLVHDSYGFDIAVYKDPLSYWNERFIAACRGYGHSGTRQDDSTRLLVNAYQDSCQDAVYHWYNEMGVTHVMVIYPYDTNFDQIPVDTGLAVKVMNIYYPKAGEIQGMKYVNSQNRIVNVGFDHDLEPANPLAYWSNHDAIRNPAERTPSPELPNRESRQVVAMGPGDADTLWRATSYLGSMAGWDGVFAGWLDSSIYMPMHYRITWAVDPDSAIQVGDTLAEFYWIAQAPNEGNQIRWYRYPMRAITLQSADPGDTNNWNVSEFYEDAHSGIYNLLDEDFHVTDTTEWFNVHFGPEYPPDALDEYPSGWVRYGNLTNVRMAVNYRGAHRFYLNRVEVYDEANWRLLASEGAEEYQDSIAAAFETEMIAAHGKSAGWYYDEQDLSGSYNGNPAVRSLVKIDSILVGQNLPGFIMNGYPNDSTGGGNFGNYRTYLFDEEDQQGVHIPVQMNEFYFLTGGLCVPNLNHPYSNPFSYFVTSTSSDTSYIDGTVCGSVEGHTRWEGHHSLQCSIDGELWGWRYATDQMDPTYDVGNPMVGRALVLQTKIVHEHGDTFWALLQGGQDNPVDADWNCCPLRAPTPNEVKLGAWLAVACDVDGIMWYPWLDSALIDVVNGNEFQRNGRYWGAKDACVNIKRIAPILESLEFETTYASRAFEHNYPDSFHVAAAKDILFNSGGVTRVVGDVKTWAPDGNGWSETEETNSYVQVSRFRNPLIPENDVNTEDYWFLVVNRRALPTEARKVQLSIQVGSPYVTEPYFVEYVLGDSMRVAAPCPEPELDCQWRFVEVYLSPGEAELLHFTRGAEGCSQEIAQIDSGVTIQPLGSDFVQLRWNEVTQSDETPFDVSEYFVFGATKEEGPFVPIGVTEDTSYVDSVFTVWPQYYYMIEACGEELDRP